MTKVYRRTHFKEKKEAKTMVLLEKLIAEKNIKHKGGIYHKLQVDFAYNSNHIEGSRLTHDQTRYIYETHSVGVGIKGQEEVVRVNDIIETVNHFRCFDYVIDTINEPVTEEYVKYLHKLLKSGVIDSNAVIGEYKTEPNEVGTISTSQPEQVSADMNRLLSYYDSGTMSLYDIAHFHAQYEKIHPFYDGNGRTGRLLMFKQCLQNDVLPFIIDDNDKLFYYMGLGELQNNNDDERLINVFLSAQDNMASILDYFKIDYIRAENTYAEVIDNLSADSNDKPSP